MKIKDFKFAVVIVLLQIVFSFIIGLSLPEDAKVPSHWNFQGEIDGWSGKWTAILLFPAVNLALLLLAVFFPALSPRFRSQSERFRKVLPALIGTLIFFFAIIHIYSLLLAKSDLLPGGNFILIAMGLMFIFLGNLLPKVPSNFYVGVRVPWTLSSETVWRKTHRLAGWCFFSGGLLMILAGFSDSQSLIIQVLLIFVFVLIIVPPVLYSFISYKKERKK